MRIFAASLATETNTFAPIPTDRRSFQHTYYPPGTHPPTPTLCSGPIVAARAAAAAGGHVLIEGTATWAEPAGIVGKATYEGLRDEILGQLSAAMPVDVVLFGLHGCMVAHGYDDCEGDLLARARAIAPQAVIGAELDLHAHLSDAMVTAADVIVAFKEFPHTDFLARAEDLTALCLRAARKEIAPVAAVFDCRMIGGYMSSREPGRSFVDRLFALEGRDGILSVSVIHGFQAADVYDVGTKVLVYGDGDGKAAAALADSLGRELIGWGDAGVPVHLKTAEAVAEAMRMPGGPVVLADRWDNPGGGVAGDGTLILRRMIERGFDYFAVATIWDPIAVSFCRAAGEGARIPLRFGGKCDAKAGAPIDAEVEVLKALAEGWQSFGASRVPLGPTALVRIVGTEIEIILNTNRTQTFEPDIFANLGVDPAKKAMLLVKSTNHFYAGFAPIAAEVLYIDAGAPYPSDPRVTDYRKLAREIWPRVEDPFG